MQARAQSTGVKPRPLLLRPRIKAQDQAYLDFYQTLADSRAMGMNSPEPVRISEVWALCSLTGISSRADQFKYLRMTQKLDQTYRRHWQETHKTT